MFPDEAPSRFRVAMRGSTTRSVERRLASASTTGEAHYLEMLRKGQDPRFAKCGDCGELFGQ